MSTETVEALKAELLSSHSEYRELAREHKRCETRISELLALPFPSQDEQTEAAFLKKKKLGLKDRMEEIVQTYSKSRTNH
ncbi:MAG TPA: DUF465 domain-containing protein [Acidobacteriota bacterium]|nr:DUF465 domain-containing protein [Acidobacteriota bacterium]